MFGLSKYVIIALAALSAIGGFAGWRWLEVRETLAVERSQFEIRESQLAARITHLETQAQKDREASREYQMQLAATRSDADALRADVRGLRITAARRIPAVEISTTRRPLDAPEDAQRSGAYEIDPQWFTDFAEQCQADARQLQAVLDRIAAQ